MATSPHTNLVLFDGVCNLCNGFVQFLIRQDHRQVLKFGSLQSEGGKRALAEFAAGPSSGPETRNRPKANALPAPGSLTSIIYIRNNQYYLRSSAALKILQDLGGLWRLTGIFWIIPRLLRDAIYDWVGRNRYRWFGKKSSCMVPSPELKDRFLD